MRITTDIHTAPDEMTHCVVGTDLVAGYSAAGITLYEFTTDAVSCLGTFARARDAWETVDALDTQAQPAPVVRLHDTRTAPAARPGFSSIAA
jgi:hypothetical protein